MELLLKLRNGVTIDTLNEQNIAEYVQACQTIEGITRMVIEPYEALAKEKPKGIVYEANGLKITKSESISPKKHSPKDISTLLRATLVSANHNHENGKQMYGVRKFDNIPAMDVEYVLGCLDQWESQIIGTNKTTKITPTGDASAYRTNLILAQVKELSDHSAQLYVAAKSQTSTIEKKIIEPFEIAIKEKAHKDTQKTTFTNLPYGGLIVQIKSVPREEADYAKALQTIRNTFNAYQTGGEKPGEVFMNTSLLAPRPYVAIDALLHKTNAALSETETKFRQEIRVLYKPQEAFVLVE
jgi:hypothetical protein